MLGFLGAIVGDQPRSSEHITPIVEQGRIDLKTPLRWHGHLRDEPARLPWGYECEIELSGVEFEGALQKIQGGLRLSFIPHAEGEVLPDVHAGDEISVLTEARRPQVFQDEGAFDRRTYLAQHNIDLVTTLRASDLMECTTTADVTAATRLARIRRRLRTKLMNCLAPVRRSRAY